MNKGVIIGIVVVVLIIILGGGYYWYSSSKKTTTGSNNNNPATNTPNIPTYNEPVNNTPQMGAPRADWMCGPNYGNAQCPKGTWCGPYQLCGTSEDHKKTSAYSSYSNP